MNILTEILRKLNKNYETMLPDEKQTFDNYEKILAGGKVTTENIEQFLQAEILKNIKALTDMDIKLNDRRDIYLKMAVYRDKMLLEFINSPQQAAKNLEAELKNRFKIN